MTSSTLKLIAIAAMFIDHIGYVFFPEVLILRIIGRIAFPIFAYLIVEGFYHTRNIKKYTTRLFIFGLLSEVPFDLAFHEQLVYLKDQNVFFNLTLGLVAISLFHKFRETSKMKAYGSIVLAMILATVIYSNYIFLGILCMFCFYLFREDFLKKTVVFTVLMAGLPLLNIFQSLIESKSITLGDSYQIFAVFAMVLVYLYNGKKGINLKYFFYGFYPAHFILIYLIRVLN